MIQRPGALAAPPRVRVTRPRPGPVRGRLPAPRRPGPELPPLVLDLAGRVRRTGRPVARIRRSGVYDIGTNWGNNQLEYDTDRPENVSLDGQGNLVITARREDYHGPRLHLGAHQHARALRADARPLRGPHPAAVGPGALAGLLAARRRTSRSVGWPGCGEIDIMEYRGQEPSIVHGSLHGPGYSGGDAVTHRFALPRGALRRRLPRLRRGVGPSTHPLVGGRHHLRRPSRPPTSPPARRWVFDHPFFIILNVAVGRQLRRRPRTPPRVFPQTMLVDYVRVYAAGPMSRRARSRLAACAVVLVLAATAGACGRERRPSPGRGADRLAGAAGLLGPQLQPALHRHRRALADAGRRLRAALRVQQRALRVRPVAGRGARVARGRTACCA